MNLGPYELGPSSSPENGIYAGDCRRLMAALPDECIGLVITSPPYNVGRDYQGFDDNLPEDEFRQFNAEWLRECYRVCEESARLYLIVSDQMLFWMRPLAESIGWIWGQNLYWCKPNLAGGRGRISADWHYMTEPALLLRKGKRTPMLSSHLANCYSWQVVTTPQTNFREGRIHTAQLPISLCVRYMSRTPGKVVLDPFAGSGSVLIAAKILGRTWIGFEIVEEVAQSARERVRNTQPPLFVAQAEQLAMIPT